MLDHLYFIESAFCPGLERLVRSGKAGSRTPKVQRPTSAQWLALMSRTRSDSFVMGLQAREQAPLLADQEETNLNQLAM